MMHRILFHLLGLGIALVCSNCTGPLPAEQAASQPTAASPGAPPKPTAPGGLVARENPVVFKKAFDDEVALVKVGLRNTSAKTIHLQTIRGSCGCMRVGDAPASLAPGQEVEIGFSLRLAGFSGRVTKFARLFSDDPLTPELRVRIEGEVGPRLVIEPGRVVVKRDAPDQPAVGDLLIRSGADEVLDGLTAVASLPNVEVTTVVEATVARLRVVVPPELEHPRGTITIRFGKYERVLRLTDGSSAASVVMEVGGVPPTPRRPESEVANTGGATRLAVAFAGQDLGEMEPCGCSAGMFGGLARRPARLRAFVEPEVPFLAVAGGALVAGSDPYDRLRLDAFVEALGTMGFAGIAPTGRELALGAGAAEGVLPRIAPPMVAVDIDEDSVGNRDLSRMLRFEPGNQLVYVTGISGPVGATTVPGVRFVDPAAALRELRDELPVHAPLVILANVGEEAARELARHAGRPTLVLYAGGWTDPGPEDVEEGSVTFAPFPAEGKYAGLARLHGRGGSAGWSVEYRAVEAELPEDRAMLDLHQAHRERMRSADLVASCASNPRFTPSALASEQPQAWPGGETARYVGSEACAGCHGAASTSWAVSRHGTALQSLRKTGDHVDPACVACHVTGYGTGRGFTSEQATPQLAHVGCEACHGPRSLHVAFRSDPVRSAKEQEPMAPKGQSACALCHDAKHDPNFQFDTYWPKIVHGR